MKHIKLFNGLNEEKSRDIVPESQVKKGMLAEDYFGELWTVEKIVPIDKFNSIKSFDESGAMSDALRDPENEIPDDTTHLIAVTNEDGESGVFCYAPEGACVWTDWEKHKKTIKESSNSTTKGLYPELFESPSFKNASTEAYIEKNLAELIKSCKGKIFRPDSKVTNEQVLGVIISKFCDFDINKILEVCASALEDSNAHDLADKIKEME